MWLFYYSAKSKNQTLFTNFGSFDQLVRSIRVYRYNYPPSIAEVRLKLEQNKTYPNLQPDKNDVSREIPVPSTISEIKQHTFGIIGYLKYGLQKKNEFSSDERFDITSQEYNFLISPQNGILILHGSPEYRIPVIELLSKIIHGEDSDMLTAINIEKTKLKSLTEKIIRMNSENNLEEGKFRYSDRPYKSLKKVSFATIAGFCATTHPYFLPHYEKCSEWSCVLRVYKCYGIMDEKSETSQRLVIGRDASFSLTIDADLTQWNRFIIETCKTALDIH